MKWSEFLCNKKIRILLCAEFILILAGIFGLFGKSGLVVGREDTGRLMEEGVSLPAGVYTLKVHYQALGDNPGSFSIVAEDAPYRTLLSNSAALYEGISERECQFYLLGRADGLKVQLDAPEMVELQGMEIYRGNEGGRIYLFWVIVLSIILDALVFLGMHHRKYPVPAEKQLAIFGVPLLGLVASIPVMVDYNVFGADLVFHMMRIEALADSIRLGELSVRLESMWLAGHGYASAFFYGNTVLAVPALLRLIGFSPDSTYRMFTVVVNLLTAWIAYLSFSKCFRSRYVGVFGCALYTLAPFRLYNLYNRVAVGEFTAMMFLPLLAWGFYKIYTEEPEEKGYGWNWIIPVIGFSGIIQSHVLTCEMAGGIVILLCLVLWKKTFRRRTFLVLLSTVGLTIVVNAWFLVPFLDLMTADQYYLGNNANVLIQDRGILAAHLFYTLQAAGGSSHFVENGMVDTEPFGLGAAVLASFVLWLALRRHQRECAEGRCRADKRAADIGFALAALALFMSTRYFPWDYLSSCNKLFATLIGSLQFPTRMLAVATVLGVFASCAAAAWWNGVRKSPSSSASEVFSFAAPATLAFAAIGLAAVVFGSYQLNGVLLTKSPLRLYSIQNVGTAAIMNAEYLPVEAEVGHMDYHAPVASEGIVLEGYEKDGLEVRAQVSADTAGYVEFPLLYYKGYRGVAEENGERLLVEKGDNCDVRVLLEDGFQGGIRVWYAGMWYWRAAEAVSVIGGAVMLLAGIRNRRGRASHAVSAAT